MVDTCPHCGAVIPLPTPQLQLSPSERRVYDYVAKHPGCLTDYIISHMYGHLEDGGPELARGTIHVYINRINKKLEGHRIQSSARGPGATYRLMKVPPNASV